MPVNIKKLLGKQLCACMLKLRDYLFNKRYKWDQMVKQDFESFFFIWPAEIARKRKKKKQPLKFWRHKTLLQVQNRCSNIQLMYNLRIISLLALYDVNLIIWEKRYLMLVEQNSTFGLKLVDLVIRSGVREKICCRISWAETLLCDFLFNIWFASHSLYINVSSWFCHLKFFS